MNEVIKTIKERRSVRTFKEDALKKEILEEIVAAGIYAPTSSNKQPWHFSIIQDRAVLDEINREAKKFLTTTKEPYISWGHDPKLDLTHGAPVLIMVSAKIAKSSDSKSGIIDSSAAMMNMMLAAKSLGVDSCWLGIISSVYSNAEMMERLGVPNGYQAHCSAVFGYGAIIPEAPERKTDVVNYIGRF